MPKFARKLTSVWSSTPRIPDPLSLINGCVNQHCNTLKKDDWTHSHNMMNFCRSCIRRKEDLLELLDRLARDPGTVIRPDRRAGYARKWADRIRKNRHAAHFRRLALN